MRAQKVHPPPAAHGTYSGVLSSAIQHWVSVDSNGSDADDNDDDVSSEEEKQPTEEAEAERSSELPQLISNSDGPPGFDDTEIAIRCPSNCDATPGLDGAQLLLSECVWPQATFPARLQAVGDHGGRGFKLAKQTKKQNGKTDQKTGRLFPGTYCAGVLRVEHEASCMRSSCMLTINGMSRVSSR